MHPNISYWPNAGFLPNTYPTHNPNPAMLGNMDLLSILAKLDSKPATPEAAPSIGTPADSPVKILLADDDIDDSDFFQEVVTDIHGSLSVKKVTDGYQLMKTLTEENTSLPDVLFLDLNMPGKNGKECLKEIRENRRLKNLPVVIYSTSSLEKDIRDTEKLGANHYMTKQVTYKMTHKLIRKIFCIDLEVKDDSLAKPGFVIT